MANQSTVKRLEFVTFDVFTETRFEGNPLAIVKVPKDCTIDQKTKQTIAREFNFSETVFLHEAEDASDSDRRIDIFTTTDELPFAGHPTIGSICCIGANEASDAARTFFTLHTKAGPIIASYDKETSAATAEIPHNVHIHSSKLTRAHVQFLSQVGGPGTSEDLLGQWPRSTSGDFLEFPVVSVVKGMTFILIELPNVENYLSRLQASHQLSFAGVVALDEGWAPSFIAPYYYTILSSSDSQPTSIRSRMMDHMVEDPATGSAASAVAGFLSLRDYGRGRTHDFRIEQGVEMGRASEISVEVRLTEDGKSVDKIFLSGSAVQATEGTLML